MLRRFFLLLGIVFILNFISAEITIPKSIVPGEMVTVTIDNPSYSAYIHFYSQNENGSWDLFKTVSLMCRNSICTGSRSFLFNFSGFLEGGYIISVYSFASTSWLKEYFSVSYKEIICSDQTINYQCSLINLPKYCGGGILVDKCSICGCPIEKPFCSDEICLSTPPIGLNKKSSFYSDKMVFLISDNNWKEVLPFISVTTWTESNNIKTYPTLIYHDESINSYPWKIDVDSIVYLLQQYSPTKLVLLGSGSTLIENILISSPSFGVGLPYEDILKIKTEDYFGFWETFDTLVYVKDDYELALLASTYASLLNAPLIIQGTAKDSSDVFAGRKIICVGEVNPSGGSCTEKYDLEGLRQKYKSVTNTNKIILVNPDDWNIGIDGFLDTEKTSYIHTLYTKTSLSSPILASAKHELILSTKETESAKVDNFLNSRLSNMKYLTIIASPSIIPHKEYKETFAGMDIYWALDPSLYADVNGDRNPDVAVGRIAGISSSDVSTNIARSVFYSEFQKTNNMKFMGSSFYGYLAGLAEDMADKFRDAGYNTKSVTSSSEGYEFFPLEWINQDLIFYTDHGTAYWSGIYGTSIPVLKNSLVFSASCLTASTAEWNSFWALAIRKGAVGYLGAVSTTLLSTDYFTFLNNVYYYKKNIGNSFKESYSPLVNTAMTTYFGDPTLNINPPYTLKERLTPLCMGKDIFCLTNSWCCSNLQCSWFTCKDCKSETQACLTNTDCCSNLQCSWFTCKDCKSETQACLTNTDCCSNLQCSWFTCKDCKTLGKACFSNNDCCSNKCSWFTCRA